LKLLGAIIAGGKAQRFGSDKALALLNNKPLLQHVHDALTVQVDSMIICGRSWPDVLCIADKPHADMGPLGGLCAALHHAQAHGFDAVLTAGCDVLPVPDFAALKGKAAAVVAGHYLFGFWPATLAVHLAQHLASQNDGSMQGWMTACQANAIDYKTSFYNMNTPADLSDYTKTHAQALMK
jgi:molybdenum cofactor guanylyltransferase